MKSRMAAKRSPEREQRLRAIAHCLLMVLLARRPVAWSSVSLCSPTQLPEMSCTVSGSEGSSATGSIAQRQRCRTKQILSLSRRRGVAGTLFSKPAGVPSSAARTGSIRLRSVDGGGSSSMSNYLDQMGGQPR